MTRLDTIYKVVCMINHYPMIVTVCCSNTSFLSLDILLWPANVTENKQVVKSDDQWRACSAWLGESLEGVTRHPRENASDASRAAVEGRGSELNVELWFCILAFLRGPIYRF